MTGTGPDPRRARWADLSGDAKGAAYDARWQQLAAEGASVHGEADLVEALIGDGDRAWPSPPVVLDAGCGTGRVAIELAGRGLATIGVDRDHDLLATARAKASGLRWIEADLLDLGRHVEARSVDVAVLAGNVMIFVEPGTERSVLAAVASTVAVGGLVVAGFQIRPGGYDPDRLDADAAAAGLRLHGRWSTWDRQPGGRADYQVSVHVVAATSTG